MREEIVEVAKSYLGTPYKKLDCSAFCRAVFRKFNYELPRTAAAQAESLVKKKLITDYSLSAKPEDIAKNLKVGTLVYWQNKKKPGRYKDIRHVSIYIGDGNNIESAGEGVKIRKLWETKDWQIIMSADITSLLTFKTPESEPVQPEKGEEMIQIGQESEVVREWQKALITVNPAALPKYGADGDFGSETEAATKAFQKSVYLMETGIVDTATQAAMFKALRENTNADELAFLDKEVKSLEALITRYDNWKAGVTTATNMKI